MTNDFSISESVRERLREKSWLVGVLGVVMALVGGWLIGTMGVKGAVAIVMLPVVLAVLLAVLLEPKVGLVIYLTISFALGWTRFMTIDIPVGLLLDGTLSLTMLGAILNGKRMNWKRLHHPVFYAVLLWFFYTILEYFNPEVPNSQAWFFKIRATSLNMVFLTVITFVMPITRNDIKWFVIMWLSWSVFGALWAFKQQYIGLAPAEMAWLASGPATTHYIWGQLRCFSFYSDAAQFGAEMAGATLIGIILLFNAKSWGKRIVLAILVGLTFWGFALSGTRSALYVLVAGIPMYLLLLRKPLYWVRGAVAAAPIVFILVFTNIGDSVYHIYRLRTALRPSEDPSFMLRVENQRKLHNMMSNYPFGAGLGTSGANGARFSPSHWAASVPPDSWYVELWIETGIVGTIYYIIMMLICIAVGIYKIWHVKDRWLFVMMAALLAEYVGIALMCYSNAILAQYPTSALLAITAVLFSTCERWDKSRREEEDHLAVEQQYWNIQREQVYGTV